ncbi:MAG: hypothetical protein KAS71_01245, partial [Bacteroidales bacterium]|nr:hypothetical protein [Bacteroidales bacterium]
ISGLTLINGDHTLNIEAKVKIIHNIFKGNLDGMSFESGGGGYVAFNYAENDRDDPIDLDISLDGSDIIVEHNLFINSNDDGIEIRLFTQPDQNINYIIRENTIIGSNRTGIQLISYDVYTGKEFHIHNNIIRNCQVGLGCMDGSGTIEDLTGALKMDEQVYFYNNTLIGNRMGATGGINIIAANNVVAENELGGFKLFGAGSAILNNLFYNNGVADFIDLNEAVIKNGNIFSKDPLIDNSSYTPIVNSPCIDAGVASYVNGASILEIASEYIIGSAPDIGAIEYGNGNKSSTLKKQLIVDAGDDVVLVSPANKLVLKAKVGSNSEEISSSTWNLESGQGQVEIVSPGEIETNVIFQEEGIYKFSFTCLDDNSFARDNISVRYIKNGDGKQLFMNDKITNIIEAEDYAYSYGDTEVLNESQNGGINSVLINEESEGNNNKLEYSVGTSENTDWILWLLVKNNTTGESTLNINFNNKELNSPLVENSKKWKWLKVEGTSRLAAGQWPLIIGNKSGSIIIDKILITSDSKFKPEELK